MRRFKPGIGAITQAERRGFSSDDQERALAECKKAQYIIQNGQCILCSRAVDVRRCRWVSARGVTATLSEWAKAMTNQFDHETMCPTLRHRSPEEIRAEYANGNRGHELACSGCAQRFHHSIYGENGAGAAYRREYQRLAHQRGLSEEDLSDPSVSMGLHHAVIQRLSESRATRLHTVQGTVDPNEVQGKSKPPGQVRHKGRRRLGSARAHRDEFTLGERPVVQDQLAWERDRPETPLERQTRELLESLARNGA